MQLFETFSKPTVKAKKHSYLPPHRPREPFSRSTRANISELHYTERGDLTREDLSNLVLSVLTQVLTLQLRRSIELMVVAVELSLLTHLSETFWWISPLTTTIPLTTSFIEGDRLAYDVTASVLQNLFQNSVKTELSAKTEFQRKKIKLCIYKNSM